MKKKLIRLAYESSNDDAMEDVERGDALIGHRIGERTPLDGEVGTLPWATSMSL